MSSVSCTLPNVTAGDLITVEFSDRNGYMTSISDGANGTYGKIYYVADSGDPNYSGMAYFANSKAGSLTVKLALSRSDHWAKISVQAWKGAIKPLAVLGIAAAAIFGFFHWVTVGPNEVQEEDELEADRLLREMKEEEEKSS